MSELPPRSPLGAFGVPNYARYFAGQLLTNTGLWFQNLTVSLIVVGQTGSAMALGLVTAAQFLPTLFLGGLAGRLSDTLSPRTILIATSGTSAAVAVALALVVDGSEASFPLAYALLVCGGIAQAFDRVAAQAIVYELVGPTRLHRAVVLATTCVSVGRSVGPGAAGLAFLAWGASACLLIHATACVAALLAVVSIRSSALHRRRVSAESVSLWRTVRELPANRALLALLIVNVVITVLAMNMNVVITSSVTLDFEGDAGGLGLAHMLNAIGAIAGAAVAARLAGTTVSTLVPACTLYAAVLLANGLAPSLTVFLILAPVLGIGIGLYQAVLQSAAQGSSSPEQIGRTMSLVAMGNYGLAPIGALAIGYVIDHTSGRTGFQIGAVAALACAVFLHFFVGRTDRKDPSDG